MKLFENKHIFRYIFIAFAFFIAVGTLLVSSFLVKELKNEERNKIEIWAEATKELASSEEEMSTSLIMTIIESNKTIPIILYDETGDTYLPTNITLPETDIEEFLKKKKESFASTHTPILVELEGIKQYIYYDDSYTLKRLQLYPFILVGVMTLFVFIAIVAILSTKKMEQDRVWVGLSKETAHQLGTPLSSLLAWVEYLKMKNVSEDIINEMGKDLHRLQMITDRFSKIGSQASLEQKDVRQILNTTVNYLEKRMSKKVTFHITCPEQEVLGNINEPLLGWVIENLTKNAVDAMNGIGSISYNLSEKNNTIYLEVKDTGKGIPKSKQKSVFSPGFTTKSRGWGLGLSLAKRIVESHHKGKIYVKHSEQNSGTTFCIELKR